MFPGMPGLHRTMLHNLLIVKFKDHMADHLSVLLPLHRQAHIHRNLRTTPGSGSGIRATSDIIRTPCILIPGSISNFIPCRIIFRTSCIRCLPGSIRTTRTTSSSTAASARKWNHHSPGSLRRPFHRIRSHIHNNLCKKLHMVFLRRSKLDTDQLHLRLPDLMRGSIGKHMDPDLPGLRIVFNLIQQSRNILVIS